MIPLELYGEVITASGSRYRWDANQSSQRRPRNLSFSTKIGEGFSSAQMSFARRIDLDYPDLNLVDSVRFLGADGSVAWEGRVSAMPRELGDSHSIGVTLTGWMAHAKDRKFQEIYVDRDLNAWGDITARQRAALLTANYGYLDAGKITASPEDNQPSIESSFTGAWTSPYKPRSLTYYYAGGIPIGRVRAEVTPAATVSGANWQWYIIIATDDLLGTNNFTGNLSGLGSGPYAVNADRQDYRYAGLEFFYNATPAGAAAVTYQVRWYNIAVYGTHGLPRYTGETGQPEGVLASDVIKNIVNRWCPQLNTAGVKDTTYVIQHLTFKDRTFPYDAFLEINKYHLWKLAVWENKTLYFEPYDLTDYDWEIRTDDEGTTFAPQGPAIDDVFNGIAVKFTDALKGTTNVVSPDTHPEDLATSDPLNPWTMHGLKHWDEIELSTPTTKAQAVQLGRAALAERNTPKTPGTITVSGYIRDRAGNPQPVWKVRAGDTIAVTNYPNDRPRLIVETSYDNEQKQVSLSIDRPFALLDAYLDRVATAVGARGL